MNVTQLVESLTSRALTPFLSLGNSNRELSGFGLIFYAFFLV